VSKDSFALEESLIREATARIQKWLRSKGRGEKTSPSPRLAIKFCGGCNPVIDRGLVAQKVREELSGGASWVSAEEEPDFLLIINGCRTACADTPEIRSGRPVAIVSSESVSD